MIEQNLRELLEEKVTVEIEGIDRLYLNAVTFARLEEKLKGEMNTLRGEMNTAVAQVEGGVKTIKQSVHILRWVVGGLLLLHFLS